MSDLQLSIVTPEGKAFEGSVATVVAPGIQGSFGVLRQHAPLISALETGILHATTAGGDSHYFVLHDGFVQVRDDTIVVLANRAEEFASADEAKVRLKAMA